MENKKTKRVEQYRPSGIWTFQYIDEWTGKVTREFRKKNLVPTIALQAYAAQFDPLHTNDVGDNLYICLGSDSTAAAMGNTTLGAETIRKAISVAESLSVVASIYVYYTSSEIAGTTHREVGLMGDGNTTTASASANSGILYSRAVQAITVPASQGLQIQYDLTMSS